MIGLSSQPGWACASMISADDTVGIAVVGEIVAALVAATDAVAK